MIFDDQLEESLARLAALLRDAEQPWWIFGSAAVAVHGGEPGEIRDIDVVLDHNDAERCMRRLKLPNLARSGDPLFRSDLFARWTEPPVDIELMAGLQVMRDGHWRRLSIHSRETAGDGLFVPSRQELCSILTWFGREKDLRRAAALA